MLDSPASLRISNTRLAAIAFGYSIGNRLMFIGIIFYIGSIFIIQNSL